MSRARAFQCEKNHTHEWKISNANVLKRSYWSESNPGQYTVEGVKEGETTVTCGSQNNKKTYTVKVVPETGSNVEVYVYMKLVGFDMQKEKELIEQLGLTVNDHGYVTLGKIRLKNSSLDKPLEVVDITERDDPRFRDVLNAVDSIERYKERDPYWFKFNRITWTKLSASYGADRYADSGYTWHLDGEMDLSNMQYTVNYLDENDNPIETPEVKRDIRFGTVINSQDEAEEKEPIGGYTYSNASPEKLTVEIANAHNVIDLYYTNNVYNVTYEYEGDIPPGASECPEKGIHKCKYDVAVAAKGSDR